MRVLHIGKFYPPFAGGMEYFLADLLQALREQGVQAAALVHDHRNALFGLKPARPHPEPMIYRVPCYGRWLYAPISPAFPIWLAKLLREFKPDLIHLHVPNTSVFWALAIPAAHRIPWVIHWHSDVVSSQLDRRLALAYRVYRPLEQRLLAISRAVIVSSPSYLASSEPLRPWQDKCHVIPLGLNPARIAEPNQHTLSQVQRHWGNHFKVLAVGRLTYYKGHEVLIRAVVRLSDVHLVLVGEGEYHSRLESLINRLRLENRVTLRGFQNEIELHALMASCDVLCLPSLERTEAFGLVLLEAMRFQKPVIASDIAGSGVGWVVAQGGHGLLVKPNDADALASALRQLQRDPQWRLTLGQAGSQALHTLFHISQIAQQTAALYQALLPPRR